MNPLTFEETTLLCIYNPGSREGAIAALTEMRGYLEPDEAELLALTDSTLAKLRAGNSLSVEDVQCFQR